MNEIFFKLALAQTVTQTISAMFDRVTNLVRMIGFALAILIAIFVGILYITSRGSDQVKKAHKALIWLLVGIAVILVATYVIDVVKFVIGTP